MNEKGPGRSPRGTNSLLWASFEPGSRTASEKAGLRGQGRERNAAAAAAAAAAKKRTGQSGMQQQQQQQQQRRGQGRERDAAAAEEAPWVRLRLTSGISSRGLSEEAQQCNELSSFTCTCTRARTHAYARAYACTCVCIHAHIHPCACNVCTRARTRMDTRAHKHARMCARAAQVCPNGPRIGSHWGYYLSFSEPRINYGTIRYIHTPCVCKVLEVMHGSGPPYACVYLYVQQSCVFHTHTYIHTHTHTHIYIYMYVCTCKYMCLYICINK